MRGLSSHATWVYRSRVLTRVGSVYYKSILSNMIQFRALQLHHWLDGAGLGVSAVRYRVVCVLGILPRLPNQ